jgi:hypothetical protein
MLVVAAAATALPELSEPARGQSAELSQLASKGVARDLNKHPGLPSGLECSIRDSAA